VYDNDAVTSQTHSTGGYSHRKQRLKICILSGRQ